MSYAQNPQAAPQVAVPQTPIPHMGTSHAPVADPDVPNPEVPNPNVSDAPVAAPAPTAALPAGVTQDAINAAIAQVEQTGSTDGIAPDVLGAACAQIEAQAAAQGIDLNQAAQDPNPTNPGPTNPGPGNYVEAAVMDKKGTMDNFAQQRESIKDQVKAQRDAAQKPYQDALDKANATPGAGEQAAPDGSINEEGLKQLAAMMKDLDPSTVALINAMNVVSTTPGVVQSILWVEIIRAIRAMISSEAKQQIDQRLKPDTEAPTAA